MVAALDENHANLAQWATLDSDGLEAIVRRYLEASHRDCPERGCAAASLAAEIARSSRATRTAFEVKLEGIIQLITDQLKGIDQVARRRTAIATLGLLMGTLQLARAVADKKLSKQVLESGIEAALILGRGGV